MVKALFEGLPVATSTNQREVFRGMPDNPSIEFSGCPVSAQQRQDTLEDLRDKQTLAQAIGRGANASEVVLPTEVSGWSALVAETQSALNKYLEGRDFSAYAALRPDIGDADFHSAAGRLAGQGVATTGAFLHVVSKVVAEQYKETPSARNERVAAIAQRSRGFVLSWAAMHGTYDAAVARALSSTSDHNEQPFRELRFNTRWFMSDGERVMLNPAMEPRLKQSVLARTKSVRARHLPAAVFGCPGLRMISPLYNSMTDIARQSQLFAY